MREIDWGRLRLELLPHCLRGARLLNGLLRAMLSGLSAAWERLKGWMEKEERERRYGPTVKELKLAIAELLTEEWVPVEPEDIEIEDQERRSPLWLYGAGSGEEVWLGEAELWGDADCEDNRWFVVRVPERYQSRDDEIRAVIERWMSAGSRYELEWIE